MPKEWRDSVIVPVYNKKGDIPQECRGIKLMSHDFWVYGLLICQAVTTVAQGHETPVSIPLPQASLPLHTALCSHFRPSSEFPTTEFQYYVDKLLYHIYEKPNNFLSASHGLKSISSVNIKKKIQIPEFCIFEYSLLLLLIILP